MSKVEKVEFVVLGDGVVLYYSRGAGRWKEMVPGTLPAPAEQRVMRDSTLAAICVEAGKHVDLVQKPDGTYTIKF